MGLVTRGDNLDVFGHRDFGESSTNAMKTSNNGGNNALEAHGCIESDDESIIVYEYHEIERTSSHGFINSDMDIPHYMPNQRPVSEPPIFNYERFMEDEVPSDKRLGVSFPEGLDIGTRTDIRDQHTKFWLLHELQSLGG